MNTERAAADGRRVHADPRVPNRAPSLPSVPAVPITRARFRFVVRLAVADVVRAGVASGRPQAESGLPRTQSLLAWAPVRRLAVGGQSEACSGNQMNVGNVPASRHLVRHSKISFWSLTLAAKARAPIKVQAILTRLIVVAPMPPLRWDSFYLALNQVMAPIIDDANGGHSWWSDEVHFPAPRYSLRASRPAYALAVRVGRKGEDRPA